MKEIFHERLFEQTNFDVVNCNHQNVDGVFWTSNKNHPFKDLNHHRIYYTTNGQAKIQTTSREIILKPGYMYLIPAETIVSTSCDTFFDHFFIHFTTHNSEFNLFLSINNFSHEYKITEDLIPFFHAVRENFYQTNPSSILVTQGAFRLILSKFFINVTINQSFMRFYKVLQYVHDNLAQKISLQDLANIVNLDAAYFSSQFCKDFGLPPSQYICKKRIALAQTLLGQKMPVKEVSFLCGFENQFYFSKFFKKHVGISPKNYKEKILHHEPYFSN